VLVADPAGADHPYTYSHDRFLTSLNQASRD
jgi:hypothetical protein